MNADEAKVQNLPEWVAAATSVHLYSWENQVKVDGITNNIKEFIKKKENEVLNLTVHSCAH